MRLRHAGCALAYVSTLACVAILEAASGPLASVSGIVRDAQTGTVIPDVRVTLRGRFPAFEMVGTSDDSGRFEFTDVPAGVVDLSASKFPWIVLPSIVSIGGSRFDTLALEPGELRAEIHVPMVRGGGVEGQIRTSFGQPMPNIRVRIERSASLDGKRTSELGAAVPASALTDVNGRYRFAGLPAADYFVYVTPQPPSPTVSVVLPSGAQLDWAEKFVTGGALAQGSLPKSASESATQLNQYQALYYPGTASAAEAASIRVALSETKIGIDISMALIASSVVTGRVWLPSGEPAPVRQVLLIDAGHDNTSIARLRTVVVGIDGRFSISGIGGGLYRLFASTESTDLAPPLLADAIIEVVQGRSTEVDLHLRLSGSLAGMVLENAARGLRRFEEMRLVLRRTDVAVRLSPVDEQTAWIAADGRFLFKVVLPGHYRVDLDLKSFADADLWSVATQEAGQFVVPESGLNRTIEVTLVPPALGLSGAVQSDQPLTLKTSMVVVFPSDRSLWQVGSSRIRWHALREDSTFEFAALPAGTYIVSLLSAEGPIEITRALLEDLSRTGELVALHSGKLSTVVLRQQ